MSATPYRADYHMHTKWCRHATGEMRDYVEAGLARGLTEIGFSAHMPVTVPFGQHLCLTAEEMHLYVAEARRLQDEYSGRIDILIGGECDFVPGREAEMDSLIAAHPFDYVFGSVHFIDGWAHDNPRQKGRWEQVDVAAAYRRYYELLVEAARFGRFDIIGHFDLVKKFGYKPGDGVNEAEAAAADAIAAAGMAVEINTAGWDRPCAEQYPSEAILRLLRERDIPICFGSDAHASNEVARHFDRARRLAWSLGWTTVSRYRSRRRFDEELTD